jgi:internalin A
MKRIFVCGILPVVVMLACGERKEGQEEQAKADRAKVGEKADKEKPESADQGKPVAKPEQKTETVSKEPPAPIAWTEVALHKALREANVGYSGNGEFRIEGGRVIAVRLSQCGITNAGPLRGMPLMMLDLQACPVSDISALEGMPLIELYLDGTAVEDLSPLAGMNSLKKLYIDKSNVKDLSPLKGLPIQELNAVATRVSDISALKGMPLQMLWLTDLPVKDIAALAGSPLVSVTLHRTKVEDLGPLAQTRIQRIHIGETPVMDLTPLAGLPLTRLVFDPDKIQKGIDGIRGITTMAEIGTKFEEDLNTLLPPAQFWSKYDAGEFK